MKYLILIGLLSLNTWAVDYKSPKSLKTKVPEIKFRLNRIELKQDDWKLRFKFSKRKAKLQYTVKF